jgi:hypothetical protein
VEEKKSHHFIYQCGELTNHEVKYSNIPKVAPYASGVVDILNLTVIFYVAAYKVTWKVPTKMDKIRGPCTFIIYLACVTDLILSMVMHHAP